MRKTVFHIFTIADYEDEEMWLSEQHANGWKIVKMIPPCFYVFESCEPSDVIYKLDFRNSRHDPEYMQMLDDFGWEYFGQCFGWLYFRKPADDAVSEGDGELFSDNESRVDFVSRIVKTRLLPLTIIFLCCVIPNLVRSVSGGFSDRWGAFFGAVFGILFIIYVYLIVHCGLKLKSIRDKYSI